VIVSLYFHLKNLPVLIQVVLVLIKKKIICFAIVIPNSSQVNHSYKRFDIHNWRQVIILQKLHYLIQSK